MWTINDYRAFARDPRLEFAFEAAATDLADELQSQPPGTNIYLDDRLWTSWPSLSFLVSEEDRILKYLSEDDLPEKAQVPAVVFAWPYDSLDFIPQLLEPPVLVTAEDGPLTRGDLEEAAYPLYVQYAIESAPTLDSGRLANFSDQVYLRKANVSQMDPKTIQVDINWEAEGKIDGELLVFVHVTGPEGLIGQDDAPLASGRWPGAWWQPGVTLRESHTIKLSEPFDGRRHQVNLGLYRAGSGERLPVTEMASGQNLGTTWIIGGE